MRWLARCGLALGLYSLANDRFDVWTGWTGLGGCGLVVLTLGWGVYAGRGPVGADRAWWLVCIVGSAWIPARFAWGWLGG